MKKENDLFDIFYKEEVGLDIKKIEADFKKTYEEHKGFLKVDNLERKISIHLLPTKEDMGDYFKLLGYEYNGWAHGMCKNGNIQGLSVTYYMKDHRVKHSEERAHRKLSMMLSHELVHILIRENYGKIPRLIDEGLAIYLSRGVDNDYIQQLIDHKQFPELNNFIGCSPLEFKESRGYSIAPLIIEYIIFKYGEDIVFDFFKEKDNQTFNSIMNETTKEDIINYFNVKNNHKQKIKML